MRVLQIKISLANSPTPIWRRFVITDNYRLDRFHQVLQIVMGWWNSHLHEFKIDGRQFGLLFNLEEEGTILEDETRFYLKNFPFKIGQQIDYVYDLGDNWQHTLIIENIQEYTKNELKCLDGIGKCPDEDTGGVSGYANILNAQSNPQHPDHLRFLGEYTLHNLPDHTAFDLNIINRELRKFSLWHTKHLRKKSTPWHLQNDQLMQG